MTGLASAARAAVGAIVLASLAACAQQMTGESEDLAQLYRQAIYDSAVKRPSFQRKLTPIDAGLRQVTVVTLTTKTDDPIEPSDALAAPKGVLRLGRNTDSTGKVLSATWVSLPSESRPACKGAQDPVLALEQLLGMPPAGGEWELVQFSVAPEHVFRPCASGPDISTTQCSFALPTQFSSPAERRAVEETQLFVFGQMWNSYVADFPTPGYPFTGMGWTYNWSPASKDHTGISEYVVKRGAPVSDIRVFTPSEFCNGG
ncbi:hypothetical protein AB4Z01_29835 [Inquilinus sp. YAF38]|uniref:hypothetical protein n=1 Tax=Inquilinus sp. YAF38 TaxID=3233084 RepID=UPI003F8EB224